MGLLRAVPTGTVCLPIRLENTLSLIFAQSTPHHDHSSCVQAPLIERFVGQETVREDVGHGAQV